MRKNACLYRHFDCKETLLYVGMSKNPFNRMVEHDVYSSWFSEVATVTISHYATREEARAAETAAILAENPIHNSRVPGCSDLRRPSTSSTKKSTLMFRVTRADKEALEAAAKKEGRSVASLCVRIINESFGL